MPIRSYKPVTPSQRYIKRSTFEEITKTKPEKALVKIKKKTGGRNSDGHITMRGIGGGAKQKIRTWISAGVSPATSTAPTLRWKAP